MSQLVRREIRQHFGVSEHESVWRGERPDKVIFATSSVRKAVIFSWALHDFSFDHLANLNLQIKGPGMAGLQTPEEIQEYFNTYIYNGDLALTHALQLGEFEGVPVWAYPQIDESDDNDNPVKEAVNKVRRFGEEFAGESILVISSDVVGTSSNFVSVEGAIKMGKPVNYKRSIEAQVAAEDGEVASWTSIEDFAAWYKEVVFEVGATLGHVSGVAVLNAIDQVLYTAQLEIFQEVTQEMQEYLEVYMDAGLGGAWQQIQTYLANTVELLANAVEDIIPTETIKAVTDRNQPNQEAELALEQFAYAHMIGVQVLALLELIVGAQRDEMDVLAAQHGYTVTVFEGTLT
ncbi:MAG: hypothetical protein H6773_04095 [Pseudomonadales bacterium]|nr:hypothetical protein [Pseudomonadales bacterium]